jgi:hypothetical protein
MMPPTSVASAPHPTQRDALTSPVCQRSDFDGTGRSRLHLCSGVKPSQIRIYDKALRSTIPGTWARYMAIRDGGAL